MAYLTESHITLQGDPPIHAGDFVLVESAGLRRPRLTGLGAANDHAVGRAVAYRLRWANQPIPQNERIVETLILSQQSRRRHNQPVIVVLTMTIEGHLARLTEFLSVSPLPKADACAAILDYLSHSMNGSQPPADVVRRLDRAHKAIQLALRTPFGGERETALAIALRVLQSIVGLPRR